MIILEVIKEALKSLMNNRLRSFLSILGIIIGVAAVIAVISISSGAEKNILDQLNKLGTNLIVITPGVSKGSGGKLSQEQTEVFTFEMSDQIQFLCPAVKNTAPFIDSQGLIIYDNINLRARTRATTNAFFDMVNLRLTRGRLFSDSDLKESRMVAILGSKIAEDLFADKNPIGQRIEINRGKFNFSLVVIGVLEEKGQVMFTNYDTMIFIPITTWMNRLQRIKFVNGFVSQAISSEEASNAVAQIEYLLYQKLKDLEKFKVTSQTEMLSMASDYTRTFKILLGGIASIALLVGGIGIMNITLVSVTERTREIGIRKALGAKKRVILLQFLIESCTISIFGGLLGIGVGIIGAIFISRIGGWPFLVTPGSILISLVFSTLIGLFFGIYPASRAAKLDPVEALSYE